MPGNEERALHITDEIDVPLSELGFRFSRSSGPGGQHASRTESRVELMFDLAHSPSLSQEQRERALGALTPYLDQGGVMHLLSQSTRSQWRNRQELMERFRTLLQEALRVPEKRYRTKAPRAAHDRRLEEKRRRAEVKKQRRRLPPESE
jgi:ribosome-associated protein